jgi:hypothetical protein
MSLMSHEELWGSGTVHPAAWLLSQPTGQTRLRSTVSEYRTDLARAVADMASACHF